MSQTLIPNLLISIIILVLVELLIIKELMAVGSKTD